MSKSRASSDENQLPSLQPSQNASLPVPKLASRSLVEPFLTSRSRSSSNSSASSESSSSSSTNSLTSPINQTLLPPFYNRPPTPLPQSASFTSLLRPPSFLHSGPTTPDSSDSEVATSNRIAQTTPRTAPKVPTYEYYGFVLYMCSCLGFALYILWSFLPASALHAVGVHYYYNRWWSLAIPAYLVMTIVYIYVALASYNTGYLTRDLKSLENMTDDVAQIAVLDRDHNQYYTRHGRNRHSNHSDEDAVDARHLSVSDAAVNGVRQKPPSSPSRHKKRKRRKRNRSRRSSRSATEEISDISVGEEEYEEGRQNIEWHEYWGIGTDAVMDIPIGGVCEVLYGEG